MRSGPIRPERRTTEVDRSGMTYAVWEQGAGLPPDLPWVAASLLAAADVASLLASARSAVLVVGRGAAASDLLEHALASIAPPCRLYIYGSRAMEAASRVRQRVGTLSDRVLARLGFDAPADWIVVDGGRAALLLIGPSGDERRWIVPVDGPLARSLFEASRVLFWFHAALEGLPDAAGTFAFRTPLPPPFTNPGTDVALPAGRLVIDGTLPDPVVDAEIRIATNGVADGRAGVFFLQPSPKDFEIPRALAGNMTRVVWAETGLPRTTLSRERVVLDLVEARIAMQLEWPKRDAINLYHRLSRVAQKPAWQFHAKRRLAEISGPVMLEGASRAAEVKDDEVVLAPDVVVPLASFDVAQPDGLPEPPPLARRVTYNWTAVPKPLPAGAREADLVRRWRAVDEWARRHVDTLRQALAMMESEEHILDRLHSRFTGHDDIRQHRSRLRDLLDELGEAPPSQLHDGAVGLVRRISEASRVVRELIEQAHGARVDAEDAVAEAQQKAEWEVRTRRAREDLTSKWIGLEATEQRDAVAASELEQAKNRLSAAIDAIRETRRATLVGERDRVVADLEAARRERDAEARAAKHLRKAATRKVAEVEQRLARLKRNIDSLPSWSPPNTELKDERAAAARAREERDKAREDAKAVAAELCRLEQLAAEPFVFKAPPRPVAAAVPQEVAAPSVPEEAPPELGELFEHRGKRYLAVKTWEQVPRAIPVAHRLKAELVASTNHNMHNMQGGERA